MEDETDPSEEHEGEWGEDLPGIGEVTTTGKGRWDEWYIKEKERTQ